jgi:hypothetical protein
MNYPEFDASWFDYRAANEALLHGHYNKASKILRNAFADSQAAGTIDPQLLDSADTLAERYIEEGNYVHAASLYRMILDVRTKVHGDDHPDVRETRRRLALALWQTGGLSPKLLAANQQ